MELLQITDRKIIEPRREQIFILMLQGRNASMGSALASPLLEPMKTCNYGDPSDRVIEMICRTADGGMIEVGFYAGDDKPKSIIKISSQIGCPAKCSFCELGEEAFLRNLTPEELAIQFRIMHEATGKLGLLREGKPLKVNVAGTGEPLLNDALVEGMRLIASQQQVSFKVSTVFPGNMKARRNFERLADFASEYDCPVQLQVSLISTDETFRRSAAGIRLTEITEISKVAKLWRAGAPVRSQINMSLILTDDVPVDVNAVAEHLPPEYFRFRFRHYVPTQNGIRHQLLAVTPEKIATIHEDFRRRGYYVGVEATPTATEWEFGLASNVTRRRVLDELRQQSGLSP